MITLNTFSLPVKQTPVISNNKNNFQKQHTEQQAALPAYLYGLGFCAVNSRPNREYADGTSNCTITTSLNERGKKYIVGNNVTILNPIEAKSFIAGNNVELKGDSVIKEVFKAGDNLKSEGDISVIFGGILLKNNVTIKGDIESDEDIIAENDLTVEGDVNALGDITFKNNAHIKGEISALDGFKAGNNLNANILSVGAHIDIGSIKKLNEIHLPELSGAYEQDIKNYSDKEGGMAKFAVDEAEATLDYLRNKKITLRKENIDQTKKTKIIIEDFGRLRSLTIKTPTGNKDILNKFEFVDESNGEKISPDHEVIKVTKIEN